MALNLPLDESQTHAQSHLACPGLILQRWEPRLRGTATGQRLHLALRDPLIPDSARSFLHIRAHLVGTQNFPLVHLESW